MQHWRVGWRCNNYVTLFLQSFLSSSSITSALSLTLAMTTLHTPTAIWTWPSSTRPARSSRCAVHCANARFAWCLLVRGTQISWRAFCPKTYSFKSTQILFFWLNLQKYRHRHIWLLPYAPPFPCVRMLCALCKRWCACISQQPVSYWYT